MQTLIDGLACCWLWLIVGFIIGWLLNGWLCRCARASNTEASSDMTNVPASENVSSSSLPQTVAPEQKATPPKETDIHAAKTAGFSLQHAEDLTVIEGIGPKISALLISQGINSFSALAACSPDQIRTILESGGGRFRMANPESWPEQAKLAAENHWDHLKSLQSSLKGGVKR